MGILDAKPTIPPHVVHRSFPSETVVLNVETGRYHGLNATAGRILEVLGTAPSVRAAAAVIAGEYAKPVAIVERDVAAFCGDLAERGLLLLDGDRRDAR